MTTALSRLLTALSLLTSASLAMAGPVPAGLSILGAVSLDKVNTAAPTGGASLSGSLSHKSAGITTSAAFSGAPAGWGTSSLSGNLLQTGDQIGIHSLMSATYGNASAVTDPFWADYSLSLSNSSATETFTILFRAIYDNIVLASGPDAFAYSDLSVKDASNVELVFTDHRADTLFPANVLNADSAGNSFTVTLAPGQSASFSAAQHQRGGVYAAGAYSADLNAFLSLEEIRSSGGNNNDVPLPGTLPLLIAGLLAMRQVRRAAPHRH